MTSRNDPCPCGSGKKYKKCHGQPEALAQAGRAAAQPLAGQAEPEYWSRAFRTAIRLADHAAMDRALSHLRRLAPDHALTHYYRGLRAQLGGHLREALGHYAAAAGQQFPAYPAATVRALAASKAVDTAIGKHPGSERTDWARLLGEPAVVQALRTALERCDEQAEPRDARARSWLAAGWYRLAAALRQGMVDAESCRRCCNRALEFDPAHGAARNTYLFTLHYDLDRSPDEIYALQTAATEWWARQPARPRQAFANLRDPGKPLRVGYLSTDFRHHPVAYFILPVLERHDPAQVRSHVYHLHARRDEYTERAERAAHRFRHVFDLDDRALAARIESDGIDILVDLNGTSGEGRLSLLARRAAPVQVTWLGSPGTTGLSSVDYRIVDAATDPKPDAQAWNSEELLYLPRLFSVYDPLTELPPVAGPPCRDTGRVTFGSCNNIAKINPPLLECWAAILGRTPGSRLLLKYPTLDYEPLRNELLESLGRLGIEPARVELAGRIPDRYQHLEAYRRIDIQLDTFPYHGTTTTCESLVMGVPVITRAGVEHRSRVGASLLQSAGRPEWIAGSREEYVRIACGLAQDREALAEIRAGLREAVQASALMDAARFTRELEAAFRGCWRSWCETDFA